MSCPFCNIIETKYRLLEEGDDFIVILSNPRLMPGHTLVIPKRHILKPAEMTPTERKNVFDAILKWQDKITKMIATGCDVRQNFRPFLPESRLKVDHVHYHLYPRELNDEFFLAIDIKSRDIFKDLSDEERERMQAILLK